MAARNRDAKRLTRRAFVVGVPLGLLASHSLLVVEETADELVVITLCKTSQMDRYPGGARR